MNKTPATFIIIALTVVGFIFELAMGVALMSPTGASLIEVGANHGSYTFAGEPWRLLTSMFIHVGLIHLGMNMYCLYQARGLERIIGPLAFSAVYLFAGILGSIASAMRDEPAASAGASGAVFGIFGAFGTVLLLDRKSIEPDVFWAQVKSLGSFLAINLALGLAVPMIDMLAHIGGLLGGAVSMLILSIGRRRIGLGLGAAGLVALTFGVAAVAVATIPAPVDPMAIFQEMSEVEAAAIERYNAAAERVQKDELETEAMGALIVQEILPSWRATRAKLESPSSLPERFRPSVHAAARYFAARQEAFELVARMSTRKTQAEADDDLLLLPAVQANVQQASEALSAELSKLADD